MNEPEANPWSNFTNEQVRLIEEFVELFPRFVESGRFAITLSGSHGKRKSDKHSDFDFRIYADNYIENVADPTVFKDFNHLMAAWEARGYRIDGVWRRDISTIDAKLDSWITGNIEPESLEWTVWGYHLPTDIVSQWAISDPDGVVAAWQQKLSVYPPALKAALLKHHGSFIRYWKHDYHYENKVVRADAVFLAGLSAKIVHSLYQILFALNEVYYSGDGWNASYIEQFTIVPPQFQQRVIKALYPEFGPKQFDNQRAELLSLIEDVEQLIAQNS